MGVCLPRTRFIDCPDAHSLRDAQRCTYSLLIAKPYVLHSCFSLVKLLAQRGYNSVRALQGASLREREAFFADNKRTILQFHKDVLQRAWEVRLRQLCAST